MTITELKKAILAKEVPTKMVWIDQNHTLVEHYIDNISEVLNRRIIKTFSAEEVISQSTYEIDPENVIYLLYLSKREVDKIFNKLEGPAIYIIVLDEEVSSYSNTIVFDKVSRNACILYLEDYVKIKTKKTRGKKTEEDSEEDSEEKLHSHLSGDLLERVVDYFDSNLDLCMNEIRKVEVLELQGSWDKPFEAILNCLPKKDSKMRSLKWFSGGDVDTCQVLYNLYMKKLRTLEKASPSDLEIWARLIKEAIWCEACIVSGLIGDYVVDYLKLVETSLPSDFNIEYYPPVFYDQIKNNPEWGI